jgi:putative membrane protein
VEDEILKEVIFDIIKGMVMGIANIIPGVSGGTMAVSMGIYDKLIHSVTHLFTEFKKSVLTLIPIVIGMGLGIVGLSFVIKFLFASFPIQTNLLFIGLIIGGLPMIYKKVKGQVIRLPHIAAFLVFFIVVVAMAALGEVESTGRVLNPTFGNMIILFFIGVIAAATMVIPGVSGSMVLMLLGYYNSIIDAITDFVSALAAFDVQGILNGFGILVPFGIGVVVGIFAIAKLIEIIFAKAPYVAYWAIIGLIVASPFAIVLMNDFSGINVFSVITGILALAVGILIAMTLGRE